MKLYLLGAIVPLKKMYYWGYKLHTTPAVCLVHTFSGVIAHLDLSPANYPMRDDSLKWEIITEKFILDKKQYSIGDTIIGDTIKGYIEIEFLEKAYLSETSRKNAFGTFPKQERNRWSKKYFKKRFKKEGNSYVFVRNLYFKGYFKTPLRKSEED